MEINKLTRCNKPLKNKRGDILPQVIFIVLNLLFFVTLMVFVNKSSTGAFVYEEVYAKKIGLLLDGAESQTTIILDLKPLVDVAKKNGKGDREISDMIKINTDLGTVTISAGKKGGFAYPFFSDIEIESYWGDIPKTTYIIKVK